MKRNYGGLIFTFRKRITELRLKSSKKPQILTTMSVIVGSQTPLLQNPVLQGVPSGSISSGCITKQEVFKFIRQHRLQESGVVSHMQVWKYKKYIIFMIILVRYYSKLLQCRCRMNLSTSSFVMQPEEMLPDDTPC